MSDFSWDKVPIIIQWAAAAGALMGGVIATVMGLKKNRNDATERDKDHDDREKEQLRQTIGEEKLRRDLEEVVAATRRSLYELVERHKVDIMRVMAEDSDKIHSTIRDIQEALHRLEISMVRLEERSPSPTRRRPEGV